MGLALIGGKYWDEAVARVQSEKDTVAIVMETDLAYRFGKKNAESFLKNCKQVVMIDSLENETTEFADFVLPAGTFAESTGTVINNEGRAQRFYEVFVPKNEISSSWSWINRLIHSPEDTKHFDAIVEEMIAHYPILEKIRDLAPNADSRTGTQKIPRETHRYSGRTAMNANVSVHEPKPPVDEDTPLTYTMEGYHGKAPSKAIPYFWSPGWNSLQSINKYQIEVGGPLHGGNPGIRLIEPDANAEGGLKGSGSNKAGNATFEVLPAHHIFGGDELSARSAPLATRIPDTTVSISSSALQKSGMEGAESLNINYDGEAHSFKIKIDNSLPDNVLMLPKGFNETKGLLFPFFTEISKG
ncbi:MAG: molybdopterin-dependent oxidoreductase, partial [Chitinophagaceae bacterium]|nr:molybdopterin-dependent oxidoreductase [Chitinophagaceae bacterium]